MGFRDTCAAQRLRWVAGYMASLAFFSWACLRHRHMREACNMGILTYDLPVELRTLHAFTLLLISCCYLISSIAVDFHTSLATS